MIHVNDNYLSLPGSYLFSEIATRVNDYAAAHPEADIIRMGIGDVTLPLCRAAVEAMHRAVDDEADSSRFHGYGPEQGYEFLRDAIARTDYRDRGIAMSADEIFVSDGAKSDTGNICDILDRDITIAVTDPVYPVYVDTNVMSGRGGTLLPDGHWSGLTYLPATEANDFCPSLPGSHVDAIYLCYPNNPTGTTLTRDQLALWVDWARHEGALILFDAAYEAYVRRPDVPRSIYEIDGAREVAIEFRSFSKTAGFTGIRCGYTVVPHDLKGISRNGHSAALNALWRRRQTTKFNGASYVSQRAAQALYTAEGRSQVADMTGYYMANASLMLESLDRAGLKAYGGVDSPYLWVKTPDGLSSWQFFDRLLQQCAVVSTPGSGFGPAGEGFVRLTAFNSDTLTARAMQRITDNLS